MQTFIKGIVHAKIKILSLITLMSFQARKTFVHLWNTNEDIFDGIWERVDWHGREEIVE